MESAKLTPSNMDCEMVWISCNSMSNWNQWSDPISLCQGSVARTWSQGLPGLPALLVVGPHLDSPLFLTQVRRCYGWLNMPSGCKEMEPMTRAAESNRPCWVMGCPDEPHEQQMSRRVCLYWTTAE